MGQVAELSLEHFTSLLQRESEVAGGEPGDRSGQVGPKLPRLSFWMACSQNGGLLLPLLGLGVRKEHWVGGNEAVM